MTNIYLATWTDGDGNRYEQRLELNPKTEVADLQDHKQWVRENHYDPSYKVERLYGVTAS